MAKHVGNHHFICMLFTEVHWLSIHWLMWACVNLIHSIVLFGIFDIIYSVVVSIIQQAVCQQNHQPKCSVFAVCNEYYFPCLTIFIENTYLYMMTQDQSSWRSKENVSVIQFTYVKAINFLTLMSVVRIVSPDEWLWQPDGHPRITILMHNHLKGTRYYVKFRC